MKGGSSQKPACLDVAIVGGGISGLAAAACAQRWGWSFGLFEERDRLGGAMRTEDIEGYRVEWGPNTVRTDGSEALQLADAYGLAERRLLASRGAQRRYIYRHERLYRITPRTLLLSGFLRVSTRLSLASELWQRCAPADARETVAEFFSRRYSREFTDALIAPFVSGIYAGDVDRLSMRAVFPKVHAIEQRYGGLLRAGLARAGRAVFGRHGRRVRPPRPRVRTLYSYRDGLESVPRALGGAFGDCACTGTGVRGIRALKDGTPTATASPSGRPPARYALEIERPGGAVETVTARALVIATSAPRAAELLERFDANVAAPLGGVAYAPMAVVALGFARDDVRHPLDGFGALVPPDAGRSLLGMLFSSSLFPDRAPDGHVLLTVFVGGAKNPSVLERSDAEVVRRLEPDLGDILGVQGRPTFVAVRRHAAAIPQYVVGHVERLEDLERAVARHPGLVLLGNYFRGVSVNECAAQAFARMRQLARAWSTSPAGAEAPDAAVGETSAPAPGDAAGVLTGADDASANLPAPAPTGAPESGGA